MEKPGAKPIAGPEIHDLCFEIRATEGRPYEWIAEYLFHKKGITRKKDPTRPVSKATIIRWVNAGAQRLTGESAARYALQKEIAGREIDFAKEKLILALDQFGFESLDDAIRFVAGYRNLHSDRVKLYGLNDPVKKIIEHHDGDARAKMAPEIVEKIEKFEFSQFEKRVKRNDWS